MSRIPDGSGDPAPGTVPTDEQALAAAGSFAMLADATRLKLLWVLSYGEYDVTTLAELAGTTATAASQHLAKLRLAGLVHTRPDGKRRLYSVRGSHLRALIQEALYHADHQVSGLEDHE